MRINTIHYSQYLCQLLLKYTSWDTFSIVGNNNYRKFSLWFFTRTVGKELSLFPFRAEKICQRQWKWGSCMFLCVFYILPTKSNAVTQMGSVKLGYQCFVFCFFWSKTLACPLSTCTVWLNTRCCNVKSSGAHISSLWYVQRMQYCFGDWGHTVGRVDTRASVCSWTDLHNSSINQGKRMQDLLRQEGFVLTPLWGHSNNKTFLSHIKLVSHSDFTKSISKSSANSGDWRPCRLQAPEGHNNKRELLLTSKLLEFCPGPQSQSGLLPLVYWDPASVMSTVSATLSVPGNLSLLLIWLNLTFWPQKVYQE